MTEKEKVYWMSLLARVGSKEKEEGRKQTCRILRGKSAKLDRLTRMEAVGGIWEFGELYNSPEKETKEVEVKTGNEFWDRILSEALSRKRGRPRKKEKGKILPGSRIGNMMQKVGDEYTCSKSYWDDEVKEDKEVLSGVALEIFERIVYGEVE